MTTTTQARRRVVTPRRFPGRKLFRAVTRKTDPQRVDELSDLELLSYFLPERAAAGVAERLAPLGGLSAFDSLSELGPRGLLGIPGVDEGTAARLLALWEVSARITEPYRK